MDVILTPPEQRWVCPNCTEFAITVGEPNRFHQCRGLAGIYAPMVPEGMNCRVYAAEREDYVGDEMVQYDGNDRPIMAVVTERADGSNDLVVNAPTAQGRTGAN